LNRKTFRILLIIALILVLLTGSCFLLVRLPAVQTFLAKRATAMLSKSLGTKVSIERVQISFFNSADLVNFYMEDKQHDTMIAAKELKVQFKVFSLLHKKISITSVFFDGATVNLHRDTAGKTNMGEVFENFQTSKKDTVKDPKKNPAGFSWEVDLDNLVTENTFFRYLDEKGHMDLKVKLPTCNISLKSVDLKKNVIALNSVYVNGADVSMEQLKHAVGTPTDTGNEIHFLPNGPAISFGEVRIKDSRFKMDDDNHDTVLATGMDFRHLDLTGINLLAKNGKVIKDTIFADIKNLAAKDRCGFVLENLTTLARVSVKDITLNKLNLKTPHSEINDHLIFTYNSFNSFSKFFDSVTINAKFSRSKLALADLNFFIPKMGVVAHNTFSITGQITGRVNDLKGRGIEIKTGASTIFKGDFSARGLPNINETFLDVHIDRLATTAEDIKALYPPVQLPPNLNALGLVYYEGTFNGFLTDFVSQGKWVTSIGSATTDAHFKYDKQNNKASYNGDVSLVDFDIGKYLGDEQLFGKVSLSANVNGRGITIESLDAELDGNISSLTVNGYNYKNITIDGVLQKKSFNGALKIEDKNLDMDFDGRADLTNKIPEFRFKANVRNIRLKELNLGKEDFRFAAKIESDFVGAKPDDLQGTVDLSDISISRDTVSARVKHIGLSATQLPGKKKKITLDSDVADAELEGNFALDKLPKALVTFVNTTFTKDYVDTTTDKVPQDFTLDLTYYEQQGNLTQIILPQLHKLSSSRLTCAFNSIDNKLNITANIPEIAYGNFDLRKAAITSNAGKGVFDFNTNVERVYSNDSLMLDSVNIGAKKARRIIN
jgi:hypothetical protein